MSSHRRFIASEAADGYPPVRAYGFSIETDLNAEQEDPSFTGWLDYVWGGYEQEDVAATNPAIGGTINGEPIEGMPEYAVEQRNQDRMNDEILPFGLDDFLKPDDPDLLPQKDIPWGRIALATGVLVGGFIVWDKFVRPVFTKPAANETK